jgi:hypothetical protein
MIRRDEKSIVLAKLAAVKPERLHIVGSNPRGCARALDAFRMRRAVPEKFHSILECA